jgi:hypothetical protein
VRRGNVGERGGVMQPLSLELLRWILAAVVVENEPTFPVKVAGGTQ